MSTGMGTTPPWLKDESLEDVQPLNSGVGGYVAPSMNAGPTNSFLPPPQQSSSGAPSVPGGAVSHKMSFLHYAMKGTTMLLCLLMNITAIIGIEYIDGVDSAGKFFVAAYMFFFATLLFIFELMEFRRIEWVDNWFRRNFGFLYGPMGKAFFIIFIAFLCFGLGDPESLTLATGISLALFGSLQVGLYLKYPEIFEDKEPIHR